jgi:hypothetical protein
MHYERWAFDFVDFLDVAEDVKGCREKGKSMRSKKGGGSK